MATVRVEGTDQVLTEDSSVARYLASVGIDHERWNPAHSVAAGAPPGEVLQAYSREIDRLKAAGGYVTADVIDVNPETPGLEAMLAKFRAEHWHDEDEVRFILSGRGVFHVHPRDGAVIAIEVAHGDLLRVPRGTWHWFDLCTDRQIRAIRLFQDPKGWTPNYTSSGAEGLYQTVCLGPADIPVGPPPVLGSL